MGKAKPENRTRAKPGRSRFLFRLLIFLVLFSSLPLSAYLLAKSWFSPSRLSPLVEHALEQYIPRRVTWEEISFNPLTGLTFTGVRIGEHPDFGSGDFLTCRRLDLKTGLAGLIRGRIVIRELVLIGPTVTIRQNNSGGINWSDILEALRAPPETDQEAGSEASAGSMAFRLKEIAVFNGRARLELDRAGIKEQVRDIRIIADRHPSSPDFDYDLNLSLRGLALNGEGSFQPGFRAGRIRLAGTEIEARALADILPRRLPLDLPQGRLSLDLDLVFKRSGWIRAGAGLSAQGTSLVLTGPNRTIHDLEAGITLASRYLPAKGTLIIDSAEATVGESRAALTGRSGPEGFQVELSLAEFDPALLSLTGFTEFPGLGGRLSADLELASAKKSGVVFRGTLEARQATLEVESGTLGPADLQARVEGNLLAPKSTLKLDSLDLSLPGLEVVLNGSLTPERIDLKATGLKINLARLGGLYPPWRDRFQGGGLEADLTITGAPFKPGEWDLGGKGALKDGVFRLGRTGPELRLAGKFEMDHQKILLPSLKARLGSSALEIKGFLTPFSDPLGGELDLEADRLVLEEVLPVMSQESPQGAPGPAPLQGPLANLQLRGRIRVKEVTHNQQTLDNLKIKYHLTPERLLLAPLTVSLKPQGDVSLNLTLTAVENLTAYQGQAKIQQAGVSLLAGFLGLPKSSLPQGRLDLEAAFGGQGLSPRWLGENLTAHVTARIEEGSFPGNPATQALGRFLGLDMIRACEFTSLTSGLEVARGSALIRGGLSKEGCALDYEGRLGFSGLLDLAAKLRLDPDLAKGKDVATSLLAAPRDKEGNYVLPLTIRGKGKRTRVDVDSERLKKIADELSVSKTTRQIETRE